MRAWLQNTMQVFTCMFSRTIWCVYRSCLTPQSKSKISSLRAGLCLRKPRVWAVSSAPINVAALKQRDVNAVRVFSWWHRVIVHAEKVPSVGFKTRGPWQTWHIYNNMSKQVFTVQLDVIIPGPRTSTQYAFRLFCKLVLGFIAGRTNEQTKTGCQIHTNIKF